MIVLGIVLVLVLMVYEMLVDKDVKDPLRQDKTSALFHSDLLFYSILPSPSFSLLINILT